MKKSITIPKIEEDLYNGIKSKAEENNLSVSDYVSGLFEQALNPQTNEDLDNLNEEIQNLQGKIEKFEIENDSLHKENRDFRDKLKEKDLIINTFTENSIKSDEQIQQFKAQIQSLQEYKDNNQLNANSVIVEMQPLEYALLHYVSEKESKKSGELITPAEILRSMFVNYSVKGEMWFFKHPTREEIDALKAQLNAKNNG